MRKILHRVYPFALVVALLASVIIFYGADHRYPPCCDTAITISRAQQLATTHQLNPLLPYNPSAGSHLYGSFISTEALGHFLLAFIYLVVPSAIGSLAFAKWFFVVLFALPVVPLFFLARRYVRTPMMAAIVVALSVFSYWHGYMYWGGHVAQTIGTTLFLCGLLVIEYRSVLHRKLFWSLLAGITILLFFAHVLTFLLWWVIASVFFVVHVAHPLNKKRIVLLASGVSVFGLLLVSYLLHIPAELRLLPKFAINTLEHPFLDTFHLTISSLLLTVPFVVGAWYLVLRRWWLPALWLLATWLLTQSQSLGIPFYATRFDEFMAMPIAVVVGIGGSQIVRSLRLKNITLALILLMSVTGIFHDLSLQQKLKACYVSSCQSLYATQIPENDQKLFSWMKKNLSKTAIVSDWPQFGYFIPIVAGQRTEIVEGEKRLIYSEKDPKVRWAVAKKYGITHIVWDGIFFNFGGAVRDASDFSEDGFIGNSYFTRIQSIDGANLYEVR